MCRAKHGGPYSLTLKQIIKTIVDVNKQLTMKIEDYKRIVQAILTYYHGHLYRTYTQLHHNTPQPLSIFSILLFQSFFTYLYGPVISTLLLVSQWALFFMVSFHKPFGYFFHVFPQFKYLYFSVSFFYIFLDILTNFNSV